jgi:hypothetical protein
MNLFFSKVRFAVINAILPNGYMVMRDYTKSVQYITLEKDRDYKLIEA